MTLPSVFDSKVPLPDERLASREGTLLGFKDRYTRTHAQLRLLLSLAELGSWSKKFHKRKLTLCDLVSEQYPLVIFHGDVGTGKTATAECIANRLAMEAGGDDTVLFRLSNRVRGGGKVGEMGTLLAQAFEEVVRSAGKSRRAFLIIDEGDSSALERRSAFLEHWNAIRNRPSLVPTEPLIP